MIRRDAPGWLNARVGKLTASRMADAMDYLKNGKPSEKRNKYMMDLVAERMTDIIVPHYVSEAMQWGVDCQAKAIEDYEAQTGNIVGRECYFDHPTIQEFGATPDGLIGDDTVLEVKCPTTATQLRYCLEGEIPVEYQYQMAAQILCTGRHYGVFYSFDLRISGGARRLMLPFEPTENLLLNVETEAIKFLAETASLFSRVINEEK